MSANPPADGMFFVDQPQPVEPVAAPAPVPPPTEAPATAPQEASGAGKPAGMRDVPLGTLIFRAGLLAEEQVEDALQEGMRTGKRLGEVLLERGWLHERDLGRLLAGQKGLPFIELGAVSPDPAAVALLPEEKARFQTALPIGFEQGVPVVAVADPSNNLVIENLRRQLNTEPRLVVAAYSELVRKIDHAYAALSAPVAQPVLEPQVVVTPPAEVPPAAPLAPPPAVEPVVEQPPAAAVTPMPTVLPPAETGAFESVESVPPLVAAQPAPAVPDLSPPLMQPVEQPVAEPAPPAQTFAPQPEVPEPAPAAPPAVEPLTAPTEPVAPAPVVEPISTAETPTHVPEFSQLPVEEPVVQAPVLQQPVLQESVAQEPVVAEPAPEEPAPEPSTDGFQAESTTHFVGLRLSDGEHLEVGTFGSADEAQGFAKEVVRQIAATEGESAWPFFAGRFLRPETIVSVDVIAESQERWMGSQIRSRWASE